MIRDEFDCVFVLCANFPTQTRFSLCVVSLQHLTVTHFLCPLINGKIIASFNPENVWRDLPGRRHGKLFIGRPCKERADDLLLSRYQLKMVVTILTGHAAVTGHLYTVGLFDGDPTSRFCRKETETVQHIICYCQALACQRYNVFGNPLVGPKDISTASVRDLCLFIRGTGLLNLY